MQGTWCMIPDVVLHDDRLTASAKILFGKILSLSSHWGFCVSSDDELAGEVGSAESSVDTVKRNLKALKDAGYISVAQSGGVRNIHVHMSGYVRETEAPKVDTGATIADLCDPLVKVSKLIEYWATELEAASEYWNMPYTRRTATKQRRKKVAARLKDGLSEDTIKDAIRGCVWNEFHIKGGFTDLTLICRSTEKAEEFALRWQILKKVRRERKANEIAEFTG